MKKTLFINACVRPESRTRMLAQHALDRMGGEITEVDLGKENIEPLRLERLELRNALQEKRDFSHEMFRYAKAFAEADEILIAAPFWDLAFPAILRNYIENICVQGLTFYYTEEGFPVSLRHDGRWSDRRHGFRFSVCGYPLQSVLRHQGNCLFQGGDAGRDRRRCGGGFAKGGRRNRPQ